MKISYTPEEKKSLKHTLAGFVWSTCLWMFFLLRILVTGFAWWKLIIIIAGILVSLFMLSFYARQKRDMIRYGGWSKRVR